MFRVIKHTIARKAFEHIRNSYDKMLPNGMQVTVTSHTVPDPKCVIQNGAFGLRYQEMVAVKEPDSPFPPDHYCIHNSSVHTVTETPTGTSHDTSHTMQFHDPCDFYPNTFHINIWKQETVVATSRYVDGREDKLEMETFGWYDLRKAHPELGDNFVEPSRVVGCESIRGSAVIPLMYLRANIEFAEKGVGKMIGLVNVRALRLLSHYKKWGRYDMLTTEPFATDEFIPGNECVVVSQELTTDGDMSDHILFIMFPTYIACRMMIVRDRFTGKN